MLAINPNFDICPLIYSRLITLWGAFTFKEVFILSNWKVIKKHFQCVIFSSVGHLEHKSPRMRRNDINQVKGVFVADSRIQVFKK